MQTYNKVQLKNTGADFSIAHPYKYDEFFPEGNCRCVYADAVFEGEDTVIWTKDYLLRKWNWSACEYEIRTVDGISVMHSVMFEGKEFDKHILGSTYIAKMQVKELLTEKYSLSDEFKSTPEFEEILSMLE